MIIFRSILTLFLICMLMASASFAKDNNTSRDEVLEKRMNSAAGIGLEGLADWSTQYPFLDQMKLSRKWFDWSRRSEEGIEVDEHGWVTSLIAGVKAETVFLTVFPSNPIVYKHYIVRWEGKGKINYGGCAKKVGVAHGGDRISVKHHECFLIIEAVDKNDPLRNISIVPEKHIAAFDRGEVFNPDFIERVRSFRAIRFMDWMETNGSTQTNWSGRPRVEDRTYAKGVPLEIMLNLANILKADPWFNMPHLSDKNYIHNFALMVRERLNSHLNVFVEHSNEVWNWVFPQAHHALKSAKELFNAEGDAFLQWHGMRTAQICDIWKGEVFNNDKKRVKCVLGAQASWPGAESAALECRHWVKLGNKPCVDYGIDSVAITAYFTGCLDGSKDVEIENKIVSWAKNGKDGIVKAYEQVLDARHFKCDGSLPGVKKFYDYHVSAAKKRGLKVIAYEGGQYITSNFSPTQQNKDFIDFHIKINRSPEIKRLYKANFDNWKQAGGELFMHFVDTSAYTQYGSWGALEYIIQPTSPKWEAIMEFNQQPCWWDGCK